MENEAVLLRAQQANLECTDQEKVFCEAILSGKTRKDAVLAAGYFQGIDPDDPRMQNRIKVKASNLLKKKCIVHYLQKNKKKIYLTDDCDVPALKRKIYEIAMGDAKQVVAVKTDEGMEAMTLPPSFKDQIAAANVFMKMNELDRKYKLAGVQTLSEQQTMVQETKVKNILDKYKTVDIVSTKVLDEIGIDDAEFEEVSDE